MTFNFLPPLPPLRRKIRSSFSILIGAYVLVGLFLVVSVFLASGITPKLLHVNYDSIVASRKMREAWAALNSPALYKHKTQTTWTSDFQNALIFEKGNLTEPGEKEIVQEIENLWLKSQKQLQLMNSNTFSTMLTLLDKLVEVNEHGMFNLANESVAFGRKVFIVSLVFFAAAFILTIFLADGLAIRLARPIKEIAESLRTDPGISHKLKLPKPTSLEMRILTSELGELWQRLRHLQKLNLEELEAERERLETVLASVEDAVLVLDNQSRILHVSDGMLKLLSLPLEQTLEMPWEDLPTSHDNYIRLRSLLNFDLPSESTIELQLENRKRLYSARQRSIVTKSNQKIGLVYLLHDVTEARQRERLKNEFIGVLSHELKTPLQSLGSAAESLSSRKAHFDEDTNILIDTIGEDVTRIRGVANDFIQVSVVDLQSLKLRIERKPLSELLHEWLKPFQILARDKNVILTYEKFGSDVIWSNIDSVKFPWAISNLIANAIRVSEAGQKIHVVITDRISTESIQIEIIDEGPGIAPDIQKRMFEPYFQGPVERVKKDPSQAALPSGTSAGFLGLGLTIAKEVVEAHEGKIDYVANKPHGSIFRITLPSVGVNP